MVKVERQAEVTWEGSLVKGHGSIRARSGAFGEFPLTWASRTQRSEEKTSPEELMAAAHAGCYSMALSHILAEEGKPAEKLTINAICTFEQVDGLFKITTMTLNVQGKVPGMDADAFAQATQKAEQNCPVSNAIRNNVAVHLNAHLEP